MNVLQGALNGRLQGALGHLERLAEDTRGGRDGGGGGGNGKTETIPQEELTNLCMKLNKRVKILEKKYRFVSFISYCQDQPRKECLAATLITTSCSVFALGILQGSINSQG